MLTSVSYVDVHFGVLEAHHGVVKLHSRVQEAHTGVRHRSSLWSQILYNRFETIENQPRVEVTRPGILKAYSGVVTDHQRVVLIALE
jgi:hypothetical protein